MNPTVIAFVGCGYVADSYRHCLAFHPEHLALAGVYDSDPVRLRAFASTWGDRTYASLGELLADPAVSIVLNMTPPEAHAEVTRAAIQAGKHVYSEKPLGMGRTEAMALRDEARAAGIRMASAPCNMLGEAAQTLWQSVRAGRIGKPLLAYCEIDDGMVHRANYQTWVSKSGRVWPARGEFETGCTYEHAGYALTVLAAMFGPVRRVTAFSKVLVSDKGTTPPVTHMAPDFSTGVLEYDDGFIGRLTNSVLAPYDHRMRIVGEEGTLEVAEIWDYASRVVLRQHSSTRLSRLLERRLPGYGGRRLQMARPMPFRGGRGRPTMDFMRGVVELAASVREGRRCRLDEDLAVHVTEVTEALQHPERYAMPHTVVSSFAPIDPMDWAR